MTDFSALPMGVDVWSILKGKGRVLLISSGQYQTVRISFEPGRCYNNYKDGTATRDDIIPELHLERPGWLPGETCPECKGEGVRTVLTACAIENYKEVTCQICGGEEVEGC